MIPYNPESELGFKLDIDKPSFTYSDSDGLMRLYFSYTFSKYQTTFLFFIVFI